jgi:uncharacterized Zn finger protein
VRLLESLSTSYPNPRLVRGRTMARGGVSDLVVAPGTVSATVRQGKGARSVVITLPTFTDTEWSTATGALAGQVRHLADLLDGRMPEDVDEVLGAAGLSLFPGRGDLASTCTCASKDADPCAHGAAVHYALARTFDEDPFLLFALRGRDRARLLAALRAARSDAVDGVPIATLRAATFFVAKADLASILEASAGVTDAHSDLGGWPPARSDCSTHASADRMEQPFGAFSWRNTDQTILRFLSELIDDRGLLAGHPAPDRSEAPGRTGCAKIKSLRKPEASRVLDRAEDRSRPRTRAGRSEDGAGVHHRSQRSSSLCSQGRFRNSARSAAMSRSS